MELDGSRCSLMMSRFGNRPFYGTIDQLDKFFLPCYRSYLRAITVKTIYAKIVFLTLKTYAKRTNCVNESPFFKHKKNCFKSS